MSGSRRGLRFVRRLADYRSLPPRARVCELTPRALGRAMPTTWASDARHAAGHFFVFLFTTCLWVLCVALPQVLELPELVRTYMRMLCLHVHVAAALVLWLREDSVRSSTFAPVPPALDGPKWPVNQRLRPPQRLVPERKPSSIAPNLQRAAVSASPWPMTRCDQPTDRCHSHPLPPRTRHAPDEQPSAPTTHHVGSH